MGPRLSAQAAAGRHGFDLEGTIFTTLQLCQELPTASLAIRYTTFSLPSVLALSSTFAFFASPSSFAPCLLSAAEASLAVRLTPAAGAGGVGEGEAPLGFFLRTTPPRSFFWRSFFLLLGAGLAAGVGVAEEAPATGVVAVRVCEPIREEGGGGAAERERTELENEA